MAEEKGLCEVSTQLLTNQWEVAEQKAKTVTHQEQQGKCPWISDQRTTKALLFHLPPTHSYKVSLLLWFFSLVRAQWWDTIHRQNT